MRYVTVSGNTGAGKSTLLRGLGAALARRVPGVVTVDESQFHHPLLQRMFASPERWGLIMQHNFVVQRAASIISNSEDGCPLLIMERGLSEDALFFERLVQLGFISEDLLDPYARFLAAVSQSCPAPDAVIYVRTDPSTCVDRLNAAVVSGDRPVELTGDDLVAYVEYMHEAYENWYADLPENTTLFEITPASIAVADGVSRCAEVVAAIVH